jgi:hypothetical protein
MLREGVAEEKTFTNSVPSTPAALPPKRLSVVIYRNIRNRAIENWNGARHISFASKWILYTYVTLCFKKAKESLR